MSEISIDQAKCNGCMLCMQVCTLGNFEAGGDGKVHPAPGMMCFDCGHCIAVCPTEAMTHANLPSERFLPTEAAPVPYEQLIKLLQGRRSRREFKNELVSDDDIEKLLQAAVCGPSSINNQSLEFTVITNDEVIAKIAAGSIVAFEKMAKLLRGPAGKLLVRSLARGMYDEICKLRALAGIPANHKVFDSIVVGHPRFRYKRTVPKLAPKAHFVK